MLFCEICQNMLFISKTSKDNLEYVCKNCNKQIEDKTVGTKCIMETLYNDSSDQIKIDKTIKYDPTLPRADFIACPNKDCTAKENKVIYIKTNPKQIKFVYFCCNCDHFWDTN